MPDLGAARLPIDDAALVVSEHLFVSIHGDCDGAQLERGFELILALWGDLPMVLSLDTTVLGIEATGGLLTD